MFLRDSTAKRRTPLVHHERLPEDSDNYISRLEPGVYTYLSEPCHREGRFLLLRLHTLLFCPSVRFSGWMHWGPLSAGRKQCTP